MRVKTATATLFNDVDICRYTTSVPTTTIAPVYVLPRLELHDVKSVYRVNYCAVLGVVPVIFTDYELDA